MSFPKKRRGTAVRRAPDLSELRGLARPLTVFTDVLVDLPFLIKSAALRTPSLEFRASRAGTTLSAHSKTVGPRLPVGFGYPLLTESDCIP